MSAGYNQEGELEISKQKLLQEMNISYGQFYRWKRMGLIPEAWFRRRSTFTGQETFLPRQKILDRVQLIQELKDKYPLEEIALMLTPDSAARVYRLSDFEQSGWLSPQVWRYFPKDKESELHFRDLLCLMVIERLLQEKLAEGQVRLAAETLLERLDELAEAERRLALVEKSEQTVIVLYSGQIVVDANSKVVLDLELNPILEALKVRLREQAG